MDSMTPQEIIQLVSTVLTGLLAIAGFGIGRLSGRHTAGKAEGQLHTDIGYIKSSLEDIKAEQKKQSAKAESQHLNVISRLTSVEESAKQAHKRIDRLENQS